MKLIDKIFYIMLDDYYYCGKDESTPRKLVHDKYLDSLDKDAL